jgi:hypothetical protein
MINVVSGIRTSFEKNRIVVFNRRRNTIGHRGLVLETVAFHGNKVFWLAKLMIGDVFNEGRIQ